MVSFIIHNVKPCSINKGYYKTKKVLTIDGRRYRKRLLVTMNQSPEIKKQLEAFRDTFDPETHGIQVQYYFLIPPKKMYLLGKNALSMAGGDVDNYMKLTTDFLFNPKYMGHAFDRSEYLGRIENFGIDDRFIVEARAFKMPNDRPYYSVGVKLKIVKKEPKKMPKFTDQKEYIDK